MITEWKEADVETLKRLWTEGFSASEIAAKMRNGLTRNAVIGKARRLKLESRKVEPKIKPHVGKRGRAGNPGGVSAHRVQKARIAARPDKATHSSAGSFALHFGNAPFRSGRVVDDHDDDGVDAGYLIGIMELTATTCRWPHGDPSGSAFGYCGREVMVGKPYCEQHMSRAY